MGSAVLWHWWRKARWRGYPLVLVLALVGFLLIMRGTAVQHVRGVGVDGIPVGPPEPEFPLSVALLTGTVLTGGNRVELALNGDGTFPRLWDDLRPARRSILVQNYYGQPGGVADTLSRILLDRAAADVQVVVLLDAFGTHDRRVQNRSHVRAIVIDGGVGWRVGEEMPELLTRLL